MKQPISKLPFKYKSHSFADYDELLDKEDMTVATQCDTEDINYIIEACNNYPNAIELLKKIKDNDGIIYTEKLFEEIEQFLNSIEYDSSN